MSEQLYRIYYGAPGGGEDVKETQFDAYLEVETLKKCGVLILVEPCEHGGYNKHISESMSVFSEEDYIEWCPGTGQKTNNDH